MDNREDIRKQGVMVQLKTLDPKDMRLDVDKISRAAPTDISQLDGYAGIKNTERAFNTVSQATTMLYSIKSTDDAKIDSENNLEYQKFKADSLSELSKIKDSSDYRKKIDEINQKSTKLNIFKTKSQKSSEAGVDFTNFNTKLSNRHSEMITADVENNTELAINKLSENSHLYSEKEYSDDLNNTLSNIDSMDIPQTRKELMKAKLSSRAYTSKLNSDISQAEDAGNIAKLVQIKNNLLKADDGKNHSHYPFVQNRFLRAKEINATIKAKIKQNAENMANQAVNPLLSYADNQKRIEESDFYKNGSNEFKNKLMSKVYKTTEDMKTDKAADVLANMSTKINPNFQNKSLFEQTEIINENYNSAALEDVTIKAPYTPKGIFSIEAKENNDAVSYINQKAIDSMENEGLYKRTDKTGIHRVDFTPIQEKYVNDLIASVGSYRDSNDVESRLDKFKNDFGDYSNTAINNKKIQKSNIGMALVSDGYIDDNTRSNLFQSIVNQNVKKPTQEISKDDRSEQKLLETKAGRVVSNQAFTDIFGGSHRNIFQSSFENDKKYNDTGSLAALNNFNTIENKNNVFMLKKNVDKNKFSNQADYIRDNIYLISNLDKDEIRKGFGYKSANDLIYSTKAVSDGKTFAIIAKNQHTNMYQPIYKIALNSDGTMPSTGNLAIHEEAEALGLNDDFL